MSVEQRSDKGDASPPADQAVSNSDLWHFGSSKGADVVVMLNNGEEIQAHSSVLVACSDYFASQFSFETLASGSLAETSSTTPLTVHANFISSDDMIMSRILLYMYTRRAEDLAVTEKNALRYIGPAFRLLMKPDLNLPAIVLPHLRTFPGYIEHMVQELEACDLPEDQMLQIFESLLEGMEGHSFITVQTYLACPVCIPFCYRGKQKQLYHNCSTCQKCTTHCESFKIFVPISLPILWLMSAHRHNRNVDVFTLRDSVQRILRETLVKKSAAGLSGALIRKAFQARVNSTQIAAEPKFMTAYHVLFSTPSM
ncbi:hypothetical protein HKX48_009225 [Thoreauomyces humboldtii]|nr:hypothetical protein HKX48_009225 [Thoreauomyces humboldtii]